jgi:ankyrin repeat protein
MLQYEGQLPDTSNFEGRTALMLACAHGHRDIALALLSAGADPNVKDREGATALLGAVRNGHDSTVSLLRSCGAECAAARNMSCIPGTCRLLMRPPAY